MEIINIDNKISIYKTYLDISDYKTSVLDECYTIMNSQPNIVILNAAYELVWISMDSWECIGITKN